MWRVRDCKTIAGEHVATQHKRWLCLQKRKEYKVVVQNTIKLWKCCGGTAVAYTDMLTLEYEKL